MWGEGQTKRERLSCIFIHKFTVRVQFQASIFQYLSSKLWNNLLELYFRAHFKTTAKHLYQLPLSASQSVTTEKWIPLLKSEGIETTLRDIFLTKLNEKWEARATTKKKKARFRNSTITEVTILKKSVMYYLFTYVKLILEIPILLRQAGLFFSLKTMDRWQSVICYHDSRTGPLKL